MHDQPTKYEVKPAIFQAEDGIRDAQESRGLGDVYKRQYTLYVGDYFALTSEHLAQVCRVYDRAALVAMPNRMRFEYADHLQKIIPSEAGIFAVLIDYDQSLMKGPPFSVPESELRIYYRDRYDIEILNRENGNMKRRGLDHLVETTYRLTPKAT